MSRSSQAGRRFAKAMLDVAARADSVESVRADLDAVRRWLDASPAFRSFAAGHRLRERDDRMRSLLDLAAAAGLGRKSTDFLALVERSRQMERLPEILDEFERLRRERAGIVRAEIVSAHPLADDQKAELARRFGHGQPGRQLEIEYKEDPAILGGFVARIGEQIHDYSVSGRLARLRRRFANA